VSRGRPPHGPLKALGLLVALASVAGPLIPTRAGAADVPGFGLALTPTRLVIPAEEITQPHAVRVVNIGTDTLDVVVRKTDFTTDQAGNLVLEPLTPASAANWITTDVDHFTLLGQSSRTVTFTISTPGGPEPGEHQVALEFVVPAGKVDGNIRINRGLATPIFITVPGPTDSTTSVDALRAPSFTMMGPVTVTAAVTDQGNVHRDFRGAGALALSWGGRSVAFTDFTVLRGQSTVATAVWRNPPWFCICHLSVAITNNGQVSRQSAVVVIVSWQLISVVLAGLVLVGVALAFVVRDRRRRVRAAGGPES
jgi:hypothetical protein